MSAFVYVAIGALFALADRALNRRGSNEGHQNTFIRQGRRAGGGLRRLVAVRSRPRYRQTVVGAAEPETVPPRPPSRVPLFHSSRAAQMRRDHVAEARALIAAEARALIVADASRPWPLGFDPRVIADARAQIAADASAPKT